MNTFQLLLQNCFVIVIHQPGYTACMPAKRMSFYSYIFAFKEFCSIHKLFCMRISFFRFKTSPIKRKGSIIKKAEPFLHAVFKTGSISFFFFFRHWFYFVQASSAVMYFRTICIWNCFKGAAAEQEYVINLIYMNAGICSWFSIFTNNSDFCFIHSMKHNYYL